MSGHLAPITPTTTTTTRTIRTQGPFPWFAKITNGSSGVSISPITPGAGTLTPLPPN